MFEDESKNYLKTNKGKKFDLGKIKAVILRKKTRFATFEMPFHSLFF